jgi:probable HAF family extracellular repeat protein
MRNRLLFTSGRPLSLVLGLILVLVSGLISTRVLFGQSTGYVVTELSSEDPTQIPSKLNNLGHIVGRKAGSGGILGATLWGHPRHPHKAKHLGVLPGGDYSSATSINDAGEITGVSNTGSAIVPFIWSDKKGLQRLPLLGGDTGGQAVAINKHGDVAGYSSGVNGSRAYVWSRKTGVRNLNILPGGTYSRAHDINDSDEVAGVSNTPDGDRAALWTKDGSVRDLGTLPGDLASEAQAINNGGDVVGYSKGPSGMRAFLWTRSNGMQALGILPGGNSNRALAINDSGVIVGNSTSSSGDRAFIWTKETGMMDLNNTSSADLDIVLFEAHAINDKGQIIAMGRNSSEGGMGDIVASSQHEDCAPAPPASFLLTPISAK